MKKLILFPGIVLFFIFACLHVGHAQNQIFEKITKEGGENYVPDEIIVKFKAGVGDELIGEINRRHETSFLGKSRSGRFRRLRIKKLRRVQEMLEKYRKDPNVEYAEPNYIAHAFGAPTDPYYSYQWHLDNDVYGGIGMEAAWDIENGDPTVVVAVIDTGVAYENHSDLVCWYSWCWGDNYYLAPDLANTNFVPGYDFVNADTHPNDDNGHGTHVTGTIAQSTNNRIGVAGVAYNTSIMPVKVLDYAGSGYYSWIADGIYWATDNGANVINLSLGGPSYSLALEEAVAYAYNNGVTVIAAAGNDGNAALGYPAGYNPYVIAVGATQFDETLAPYSNYGPDLDLVAPGGNTLVDQNGDGYVDGVLQQTFGNTTNDWGYWFYQGTSMATPHVSGVAALLISKGTATTPGEVREALQSTAKDLGSPGFDTIYGWGLVNAYDALQWSEGSVDNPPTVNITSPMDGATASGDVSIQVNVLDDGGVHHVDFYIDGILNETIYSSPYTITWDSTTVDDGIHQIDVTATDTIDQEASVSVSVEIENLNVAPVADAGPDQTVSDVDGDGVQAVTLDGSGSYDPDPDGTINGKIASYEWREGSTVLGTAAVINHDFSVGAHYVSLTVIDENGLTGTDSSKVTVTEPPAAAPEIEVFFDNFEVGTWNGLWTEDSQNDWFRSTQRATNGSYAAEVDGRASNAQLISVPIDLQSKTNIRITFSWFIERGLDSGEYLAFDVSTDGGSNWSEQARLRGNVDPENVWRSETIELTDVNNLRIRFRGRMSRSDEDANVDMVSVIAW